MEHERRTRRCQRRLRATGADGLVAFPSPNLRYLTGFDESPGERLFVLVVGTDDDPTLVAPAMYAAQLRDVWVDDVRTYDDGDDPTDLLADAAADSGLSGGRVLLDDTLWARFVLEVQAVLPEATFGLASEALGPLRARKDETELAALREAAAVADEVSATLRDRGAAVVGATERELAGEIERLLDAAGGEGLAFDVCVASGPNGARPHHHPGDRTIEEGDPVVLDFGTRVRGYPSDQTRTMVFDGTPPEGFEAAFDAVLDAQAAAVDAVEPGAPAERVDEVARAVIEERGFGEAFVHRTGHGVGLEIHEEPYIVAGNETPLEPGMVFSVEPGVYLDGEFGVRVEDLVVVTEEGCERLNDSPRGWRVTPR